MTILMTIINIVIQTLYKTFNGPVRSHLSVAARRIILRVSKFRGRYSKNLTNCLHTNMTQDGFITDSVLRHCAGNKKRGLSMLPNVGHQIRHVKIAGTTRRSSYSYISRLRVNI